MKYDYKSKKNKVVIGKYFFETNLMVEDSRFIDVKYVWTKEEIEKRVE